MPKLSKAKRDRKKEKAANKVAVIGKGGKILSAGDQETVNKAVKEALARKSKIAIVSDNPKVPFCKAPGCGSRASTTRGLCAKHEELFRFIYFLFTLPDKKSDLLLPGEQEGGKRMTNFDLLIKGKR